MTTSSYEEWVVKELDSFTAGAVTNLKVDLVDTKNYESGTWFVNRWISPQADQPQNLTQTQNCQPQNVQNVEDKSYYFDLILCQHNNDYSNTIKILSSNITSGSTHCCKLLRPRKRRRARRSSSLWSSGTWSGTGWGARPSTSLTPGSSGVENRIVRRGRRRLDSSVTLPTSISLTANTTHTIIWDHNQSGQGGGGGGGDGVTAEAHGDQGDHSEGARADHVQGEQTLPVSTSTSVDTQNIETDNHPGGQDSGAAAGGHDDQRDQPQHSVKAADLHNLRDPGSRIPGTSL
jgi:hypothetical protein